jgi:hypothetical protein
MLHCVVHPVGLACVNPVIIVFSAIRETLRSAQYS